MPNATAMLRRAPGSAHRRPAAFTLVELLVVVGIVAMLAAITLPAIFGARLAARNAAIRAEIDMMHMAMMNYRNEYGSFPPCVSDLSGTGAAARHLLRLFPRVSGTAQLALQANGLTLGGTLAPQTALVAWLQGYASDPTGPVTAGTRRKLFDFDQSRVTSNLYTARDKPSSPFVYIDSANYVASVTAPLPFITTGGTYSAVINPVTGTFFNLDTFQILCPGLDQQWGLTGTTSDALDDISNFWPTTRGAYDASLR